jgi:NADH dehydrogenase
MKSSARQFRHRQATISPSAIQRRPRASASRRLTSGRPVALSRVPRRATEVVIYRPSRSATQIGTRGTHGWILEFEPTRRPTMDFLMGWTGGGDTDSQVRLRFPDRDSAERFARAQGLEATVIDRPQPPLRPRSYAANFIARPPA